MSDSLNNTAKLFFGYRQMTIQEAKIYGKQQLTSSPTPELDTSVILQFITGLDKTRLLLERERILSREEEAFFTDAVARRSTGLPVAYITGHKEFYGYDFKVTPDVLIPKPDTEVLIDNALNALGFFYGAAALNHGEGYTRIPSICDMCAGSGCVGLSIIRALKDNDGIEEKDLPKITFADISLKALEIVKENSRSLNVPEENLRFVHSNLFDNVPWEFDFIVTNPPYVPHSESLELLKDGRREPLIALDGDVTEEGDWSGSQDGLALIKRLIPQCMSHLAPGGTLLMETGEYNAEETARLFTEAGFRDIRIEKDINDMLRNVIGVR